MIKLYVRIRINHKSHNGYIDQNLSRRSQRNQNPPNNQKEKRNIHLYRVKYSLCTSKYIIVIIFIQAISRRDLRSLTGESGIVKPHIEQADFQPIIADQVNQLACLCRDGLLVKEHQQTIQPFGRNAVRGGPQREQDYLLLGGPAAGPSVTVICSVSGSCGGCVSVNSDLGCGLTGCSLHGGCGGMVWVGGDVGDYG